jgi:flagellar basal-body rod protein FlgB
MSFRLDASFTQHEKALSLYADRAEILANNLVNSDTPGFQARDIDFKAILESASTNNELSQSSLQTTHAGHIQEYTGENQLSDQLLYRVPLQTSIDGNTVDGEVEKTQFSENAMRYMATLSFLTHEFTKLKMVMNNQ